MAGEVHLGPFILTEESRGLRLRRPAETPGGDLHALLIFAVEDQSAGKKPISIRRMTLADKYSADIHGYTRDQIAFDAHLTYRQETGGIQMSIRLVNATDDMAMRLGVHMELSAEADPEWLIPGLFYNENRVRECQRIYPAYSEIQRDPEKFISNHWSFRSDRAAMPAIFCQTHNVVAFMSGDETPGITAERPLGIGISSLGLSSEDGVPVLSFMAPYHEEPVKYSYCHDNRTKAEEFFYPLEKNEVFSMDVHLGVQVANEDTREKIYRALYNDYWPAHPLRPKISSAEAERLSIEGLLRWHMDEKSSMIHESAAFDKHFGRKGTNVERHHMHISWLSGVFPAYVLLWHGRDTTNPLYVRYAHQVLDLITEQLAPCGTLFPVFTLDDGPLAGFGPEPGLAHSRTIAEAILFLIRAHRLELLANTTHYQWSTAFMSTLNFILKKQRPDGAFPSYWFLQDGKVHNYDGAAGMAWIAPLVAASNMLPSNAFREAALRAGEYYSKFIEEGLVYGCVEDLPLVPTCEGCHHAVIAFTMLYELDRSSRWLELARKAANLALTWRACYNISFAPYTVLGQAGFQTRGGDISSAATPILGAYGLISFGEMLKLSALTGDPYYEHRAIEARTFATQLVARGDGEFNARKGMTFGQIFHTDWWQPKGMIHSVSLAWTAALIEYAELLERHLNIPTSALEGDARDVVEAANRSSVVAMEKEIVLPDPVEVRRQKQLLQRRTGEDKEAPAAQVGEKIAQIKPHTLRRKPVTTVPAATQSSISQAGWDLADDKVIRTPTPFREEEREPAAIEVPKKEFARHPNPLREKKFFPEGVPSGGGQVSVSKIRQEGAAGMGFRKDKGKSAGKEIGNFRHLPARNEEEDDSRRPISRFDDAVVKEAANHDVLREALGEPSAEPPRKKTPLSSRHIPLQNDEESGGAEELSYSKPGEIKTAHLPPLPEPPPEVEGGLLSNLMNEDDQPRFLPLEDLPDHPAFAEEANGKKEEEPDPKTDNIEIKWKIF